jgi:stage V sporulation protein AC
MLYGKKLYFVNFFQILFLRIINCKKLNNDNKNSHFCAKLQNIIYILEFKMDFNDKKELIKKHSPGSKIVKNSILSFLFGGLICVIGQLLLYLYSYLGCDEKVAGILVTVTLIFLAALLTGLGLFDKIARHAGAGTLVPVTGFSNAVVSQAMDAKSEGYVMGVGAKIFTVAGPVILYGLLCGFIYGVIYFTVRLLGGV